MDENILTLPDSNKSNSMVKYWVSEYRANRYLKLLSRSALDERAADIVSNMMSLYDDGLYRPRFNLRADGVYAPIRNLDFLRMATDISEEMRLRGHADDKTPLPSTRTQLAKRLSDESWCRRADWIAKSRLSLDKYERPKMLFRFSKARWNDDLFQEGRIRITPASHYNDTAAPIAVRDDELRMEWHDKSQVSQAAEVNDYYCLCLSSEYDYRLFADFRSDSCVAIKNPTEFSTRLRSALAKHNHEYPSVRIAVVRECPIVYFDPFAQLPPEEATEIQFSKHFRFAYQTEFRFVLSPVHKVVLEPFFLTLGAISDIAEIVKAPDGMLMEGTT